MSFGYLSVNQAVQAAAIPARRKAGRSELSLLVEGLALFALMAWLYWSVAARLVAQWWSDPNFSHGFFVPVFSGFLIWRNRDRLRAITPKPSDWGLAFVGLALFLLVIGVLGAELFLSRISLLIMLGGVTVYFLGWHFFRALLFPWALLLLMIPLPVLVMNEITVPLQFLASKIAATLLPLAGVPVFREGNIINIPAMPLEVAEACSGIRSLISLLTLAIMYGYLFERRVLVRVGLALASIPIAVAANSLRIFVTGILVQHLGPEAAAGFFHGFSGWVVFVASLLMIFALHRLVGAIPRQREQPS